MRDDTPVINQPELPARLLLRLYMCVLEDVSACVQLGAMSQHACILASLKSISCEPVALARRSPACKPRVARQSYSPAAAYR
jgi:hypothetical protein